jgi:hypothetical protein
LESGEQFLKKFAPSARVKPQMGMKHNPAADPVLSTPAGPLLLKREFKQGKIYLWTTDMDDLEWTTIGATAFVPTYHQWILNQSEQFQWKNFLVQSDSLYIHPLDQKNPDKVLILDPHNRHFTEYRKRYGELHIGPFPRLGHYRILSEQDTVIFAVNLAAPDPSGSEKEYFHLIGAYKKQHTIVKPDEVIKTLQGTFHPLWKLFILSAAVFLLLEILISRFFFAGPVRTEETVITKN